MRLLHILYKYKIGFLICIGTFFLIGYFITDYIYNNNYAKYSYAFTTELVNKECFCDALEYEQVFYEINEKNALAVSDPTIKKVSYANINYSKMLSKAELVDLDTHVELRVQKKYFPSIASSKTGANAGENRVKNYFSLVFQYMDPNMKYQSVELIGYQNPFIIGGFCSLFSVFFLCLICGIGLLSSKEELVNIEDNVTIFSSVFHRAYWKNSLTFLKKVKSLCTISLLFSFMMICKLIPIPSGFGSLGIGFTYLFFATICLIYGPVCGIFIGFCSDVIGYFIQPSNVFFLGYTLDAMLSGFIYGLCFYKKKITFANCLIARFCVNIFINVGLGSLWWKILYELNTDAYITYMSLTSLPKNILYLLPQSILLFLVFKAIRKPLENFGLIDKKQSENVQFF